MSSSLLEDGTQGNASDTDTPPSGGPAPLHPTHVHSSTYTFSINSNHMDKPEILIKFYWIACELMYVSCLGGVDTRENDQLMEIQGQLDDLSTEMTVVTSGVKVLLDNTVVRPEESDV